MGKLLRVYVGICFIIFFNILLFGVFLPFLISYKDDFLVGIGIILMALTLPINFLLVRFSIKRPTKKGETNE